MFTDLEKNNIMLTTFASILAANGLITNSVSGVICSMLVSPYLSIIVKIADNVYNGLYIHHDFVVLATYMTISLVTGIIYYLVQRNILGIDKSEIVVDKSEMFNRADINWKGFTSIFIYAMICGATLSFISNNPYYSESSKTIIQTGIGIGVALLPSMVNSGLFIIENNQSFAFYSMMNTIFNIVGIITGICLFRRYS